MKVVFDSNVIIADRWLSGPDFRALASTTRATGHELIVPRLAIDEAVANFSEQLANAERDLAKASESLTRLLHDPYEPPKIQRDGQVRRYRSEVLERLRQAGARISPYPRAPHEKLVRRALDRRRPFDDRGHNGYRDVLMWHSVLAEMPCGDGIAFISNDRGFCAPARGLAQSNGPGSDEHSPAVTPAGTAALHPHLESDLIGRGDAPRLFFTLRDFIDREVRPRLPQDITVQAAKVKLATISGFDLSRATQVHLLSGFKYVYLDPAMLGLPPEVEHATVVSVDEVARVDVVGARQTANDLVLDLDIECEVRVETYAWQDAPPGDECVSGAAFEDEYLPRQLLHVAASLALLESTGSVTAVEIQTVEPVR